jgi:hypothetical protein
MSDDYASQYREVARLQYEEIERLRALIKQRDTELDVLVGWIAGDQDALSALQALYADPRSSPANKIKAAASAIAYERSKPASVSVIVDFKSRVRDARMQTVELRKQEWTRQPPLDLDAPTPTTILGGDREGEALDPDSAA